MSLSKSKLHEIRSSPFYRLRTKKKLAKLLFISPQKLLSLSKENDLYYSFEKQKPKGGVRIIDAPRDDLKAVQSRIANLLQRIVPPDYLFAPVKGRSYVDNARLHIDALSIRLLDIEDFFPNCTSTKVTWFFHQCMECSPDVTALLRCLVCHNSALPQGSPCSPILAYLSYKDMWEAVHSLVANADATIGLYADDITISGNTIPEEMIWEVKRTLHKHGHKISIHKERSRHLKPAEVTGVIVREGTLQPPNRSRQKLSKTKKVLLACTDPNEQDRLGRQLRGRKSQLSQISGKL